MLLIPLKKTIPVSTAIPNRAQHDQKVFEAFQQNCQQTKVSNTFRSLLDQISFTQSSLKTKQLVQSSTVLKLGLLTKDDFFEIMLNVNPHLRTMDTFNVKTSRGATTANNFS